MQLFVTFTIEPDLNAVTGSMQMTLLSHPKLVLFLIFSVVALAMSAGDASAIITSGSDWEIRS